MAIGLLFFLTSHYRRFGIWKIGLANFEKIRGFRIKASAYRMSDSQMIDRGGGIDWRGRFTVPTAVALLTYMTKRELYNNFADLLPYRNFSRGFSIYHYH